MLRIARRNVWLLLIASLALGASALVVSRWLAAPTTTGAATYVGSQTCAACHAEQVRQWTGSHHELAMCEANATTVRGDFADRSFTHRGQTSHFSRTGEKFLVRTEGPRGQQETFAVKYTFGVAPLQQYLAEFPGGRLQALSIAWDTEARRWFHLYPDETIPPDDWLHWTKGGQNWNYMCADCHSTNVHKNYDLATDSYHTTFTELNVACEACHGPGSVHVELASARSLFRGGRWDAEHAHGLARLRDGHTQIDTCARCHARRGVVDPDFTPGAEFLDHYVPQLLEGDLYYTDGQIRDEVYEYGSFLQSKMYRMGIRCSDCHNPHTARPWAEGNQLCTRCHNPGRYDGAYHHHHAIGSQGARCVECHMPTRTYMVVHARRDHSIRIPRPDLTVSHQTPNACNRCHADHTAEWARDWVATWFGKLRPDDPHYGPILAAARAGKPEGERLLLLLTHRSDVGPIVRASAAALLGQYGSTASQEALRRALADPEPLVRVGAVRGVEHAPAGTLTDALAPLLEDRTRLVRTEAARVLTAAGLDRLSPNQRRAFELALAEYERAQQAASDQATAHLNLGILYGNLDQLDRARAEYQTALRFDSLLTPARYNLALLYNRQQNRPAAEQTLRELIDRAPTLADAHYSLGLFLAEDQRRLGEAAQSLAHAVRLAPNQARMRYNYGLALQRLGRIAEAEAALLAAHHLEPSATDYLYALAVLYAQQRRWSDAKRWTEELLRLNPVHHEGRLLWRKLVQTAG